MPCGLHREVILMVDDNLDSLGFAKVFLEDAGYLVITAAGGQEALCLYEKYQSSIVLLLTDVVMSDINGLELANRVRRIDSRLPVLFISGYAGTVFRSLECLVKPFQCTELVERVSRTLDVQTHTKERRPPEGSL
jgi:DNA-binding NtrC family response regulator